MTDKCRRRMSGREEYITIEISQRRGDGQEEGGLEKGERLLGCERSGGFLSLGEGSLLPGMLGRPSLCVFHPPKQAVTSSEPNFWTHSLQIYCNGLGPKIETLQLALSMGKLLVR